MTLTPVQQSKAYDLVTEQIKNAILDGTFPPGSRLPSLKTLAQSLGVGQAAVREAISALRAIRLVEVRQGDGTFVATLDTNEISRSVEQLEESTAKDIQSLLELRIWIETGAAHYAALRRTRQHLLEMERILEQMEQDAGHAELGETSDWEFHYAVSKASHNPYMQSLMETIAERVQSALLKSRLALYRIPGEERRLIEQHQAIFEAIQDGDGEKAMFAMQQHLLHVSIQLSGGEVV
ncbi:FadR/GntR family transcriptional regulator [Alicyclobacillus tolerans]|uniref:Transcriptional regulator, GntR family n=2 Tax=Alicyclobacillus tolerans TaxID=90970 RepID=A0A1M6NKK3_9BACL|nr:MULTISPECIES: FadR/GntR family transcriptional regulator [Alicyclobacillus]MDP9727467.1 GntR family transcriptional repressor for pyruvate dehydrogenase complex [Alicyclobacillus tengchongensis]QRF23917.1 FadR family transcriptional regulator [Alicyclobacillus sp. TC]SHJ96247.1 transcriptional regulator, GntR family [Alicyclobacillus montanus]